MLINAVMLWREYLLCAKPCACIISFNLDSNYCGCTWRTDEVMIKHLVMNNFSIVTHKDRKWQTQVLYNADIVNPLIAITEYLNRDRSL